MLPRPRDRRALPPLTHARPWTSVTSAVSVLALALALLAALAAPADAAKAPPWRWKSVWGGISNVAPGTQGEVTLYCPAGYRPVQMEWHPDGIYSLLLQNEYVDYGGNWGHVMVYNPSSTTRSLTTNLNCVHGDDIGPVTTVSVTAGRSNSRSGGWADCPNGWSPLSGGVDWSDYNINKRIDVSSPTETGWYAAGYDPGVGATLGIEVHCISSSYTGGAQMVENQVGGTGYQTSTVSCPSGKRPVGTGAFQYPVNGYADPYNSATGSIRAAVQEQIPGAPGKFSATMNMPNSSTWLVARAWCVPYSVPVLSVSAAPAPGVHTTRDIAYAFTATDPVGESLRYQCFLNTTSVPCTPGTTNTYGGIADGYYTLSIEARNDSNQVDVEYYPFSVDATAPTVGTPPAPTGQPLTAPVIVAFSEPVQHVDATSFVVRVAGRTGALAGSLTGDNGGSLWSFRPAKPLVAGQRYTVSLTGAITDVAGNALSPVVLPVRAATTIQNTSVGVVTAWDPDTSSLASDGAYLSSRDAGAYLTRTVSIPSGAGQRVAVWGVRTPDGGYADVVVDGVKALKASFYASTAARARVFLSDVLAPGRHTVTVRALGQKPTPSTGPWVNVDNLTVGTTVVQQSGLVQRFRRVNAGSASAGNYDVLSRGTTGDTGGTPSYSLTFRGTGVAVLATRNPSSGSARFLVDGVLEATVDLTSATWQYQDAVFDVPLDDGVHTLRVVPVGTATGAASEIDLDVVQVE